MQWYNEFDLPKRFAAFTPPLVTEIAVAALSVLLAIGARLAVQFFFGNVVAFALVFPAVAGAALLAGWRSGALVIVAGQLLVWYFLLSVRHGFQIATPAEAASLVLTTLAEGLLLWFVSGYRTALQTAIDLQAKRAAALEERLEVLDAQAQIDRQLREQEDSLRQTRQNLVAIYDASADGLTLCRAIKDAEGRVIDYWVIEVNKAHGGLTGATKSQMLARPVSQIAPPVNPLWFDSADTALKTGQMQHFDVRSPATGRWLNIRVSPVSDDLFQQTFVDVSDRRLVDEQRQQLLKEMSHRVANNFQMMASFLHIQSGLADPVARVHLQTAENRVQVLAKLHSLLAYTESDREIDAGAYITELCGQLGAGIDRPDAIKLVCECRSLLLPTDKIVPIGFIISELVTNAAKYAFPAPLGGEIAVSLAVAGERWMLTVSDNGQGMAAPAPPSKSERRRSGLGTRLVQTFVSQIGGCLTTTFDGGGVRHEISFMP